MDNRGLFFSVHRCRDQTSANNSIGVRVEQSTLGFLQKYSFFFILFFLFRQTSTDDIPIISERSNPYYYAIYYSEYSCRKFFSFFASTLFPIIFSHFSFSFSRDDDLFVFFPPSRGNRQIFLFSPTSEDPSPPAVRSAIVNFAITNTNFSNSIDHRFFHHFWQKKKTTKKEKNMMNSVRSFFTFVPHRIPEARAARVPQ